AQHVKIGIPILVQITKRGVSTPASVFQAHAFGDVFESSTAQVVVQDALLAARRELPALKSIHAPQIKATAPFVVPGVTAYIGQEEVQQPVVVKVEEDRA